MKLKSLKQKILIFSVLLIAITVIPTIAIMVYLVNANASRTHESTAEESIQSLDSTIALFYDDLSRNIEMYAESDLLQQVDDSITRYMDSEPGRFAASNKGGIEQEIFEAFDNYGKTHPGTLYVYMGTEDGGYIQWPETSSDGNYDPRIRPWYLLAKQNDGKVQHTDPYADIVTKSLIVSNSLTFRDRSGKIKGVIAIDVTTEKITSILNQMQLGETGYFMMLHKTGTILADPKFPANNFKKASEIGVKDFEKVVTEPKTSFVVKIKGKDYHVNSIRSNKTDWILVCLIEEQELYKTAREVFTSIMISTLVVVIIGVIVSTLLSIRIVKPITDVSSNLKAIAEGDADLTKRLKIDSKDEVGDLAKWFNMFLEKLQTLVSKINSNAHTTADSAKDMDLLSGNLDENASTLSEKTQTVSSATEEMSSTIATVASAMEEYSHNISVVAASGEEMTASVNEIARSSSRAREVTANSVRQLQDTTFKMNELGKVAQEISKVTEVINAISDQTNLLALNATIEAASAGEAGKGFAVVANEIKELAKQTADATTEIQRQIDNIQSTTKVSIEGIEEINEVISEVDSIVTTIAAAVEEQSVTSREISANISQASSGIQEVTLTSSQGSEATNEIAREMTEVDKLVQDITGHSHSVKTKASELSEASYQLSDLVRRFKI